MDKKKSPMVTVTMPADKFLVCDEDHGGYEAGYCFVCKQHGWLYVDPGARNGINHKADCPVGAALAAPQQAEPADAILKAMVDKAWDRFKAEDSRLKAKKTSAG